MAVKHSFEVGLGISRFWVGDYNKGGNWILRWDLEPPCTLWDNNSYSNHPIYKVGVPIMVILEVKGQFWRDQTIFLHYLLFIMKLHHCPQQKGIYFLNSSWWRWRRIFWKKPLFQPIMDISDLLWSPSYNMVILLCCIKIKQFKQ